MDDDGVSVVIPVRNRAHVIARAVASAAAQTHAVHEIIVVDDASEDDTAARVRALAAADPRVRLITLPQRVGAPRARNLGAEAATGGCLAFLDSDDLWRPAKIERQLAMLAAEPTAPAAFTAICYRYPDRPPYESTPPALVRLEDLFERNVLGSCSTALVRRQAFAAVGGYAPDLPSCQDWELWLRLAELGPLPVTPAALTDYCYDGAGRITRNWRAVAEGHAAVLRLILSRIPDPARRRMVELEHQRELALVFSRRAFAPRPAVGAALSALCRKPDAAGLVLLARTMGRIALHPALGPLRRLTGQARRARPMPPQPMPPRSRPASQPRPAEALRVPHA